MDMSCYTMVPDIALISKKKGRGRKRGFCQAKEGRRCGRLLPELAGADLEAASRRWRFGENTVCIGAEVFGKIMCVVCGICIMCMISGIEYWWCCI